jgi:hypothetical protein
VSDKLNGFYLLPDVDDNFALAWKTTGNLDKGQ